MKSRVVKDSSPVADRKASPNIKKQASKPCKLICELVNFVRVLIVVSGFSMLVVSAYA
jgi:hypothetical protein